MANYRIPGVLGSGITLDIDQGTMALATAMSPGVFSVDDSLLDWAQRRLREGVHHGLNLVGQLAYTAAMRELQALEGDLAAKLRWV